MSDTSTSVESRLEIPAVPTVADYHRLARIIATRHSDAATLRLAVLSSYSAAFLKPYVVVESARRTFDASLYFGAFGQFEQEIAAEGSLWEFQPTALVIALRPEDVDVDAVVRYVETGGERFAALVNSIVERIDTCVRLARDRMQGPILVANIAAPPALPLGIFDAGNASSLTHAIAALNRRLAERISAIPGAYIWDYAGLVRSRGEARWTDPRLWSLARAVVAQDHQAATAAHLVRTIAATLRPPAKCLVLDLDNTLWGGVLGDDGPGGISLGDDYPGNAYKQFQRAVLSLRDRGILLAVASKNNPDIVEETLRTHPEMVLRWSDFACVRANWRSKSQNLREIATELNLGVDALVLFDDNPVERAEVRAALPAVGVIDVPTEPTAYAAALDACEFFDQAAVHAEDHQRASMYAQERERRALATHASSPEEFLRTLEMEAQVGRADEQTIGRIAQLIGKTNQFNLTTRRHSQADVASLAQDPGNVVAWLRLRDRFGDQGLVAVGIVRAAGEVAEIDTLLMSCRVMNRRVEQAFLSYLLEGVRANGCTVVTGDYLPTAKNSMVAELYPGFGFSMAGDLGGGGKRYMLDLRTKTVEWPDVLLRRDTST